MLTILLMLLSLVVGVTLGVIGAAVLFAARDDDEYHAMREREEMARALSRHPAARNKARQGRPA